jgi:PAS domain S-box-containing protein
MTPRPWQHPVRIGGTSVGYPLVILLGALVYFGLARLGLAFATLQESASPIWPASGFAVALLILGGMRLWPAIALGALIANALTGGFGTAFFITIGNTLEAVLGLLIFSRVAAVSRTQLPIAQSSAYVLAALLAAIPSAALGVATLLGAGALPWADARAVAITWWAGDALGIILLCPLILAFLRREDRDQRQPIPAGRRHLRAMGLFAGIAASGALSVTQPSWSAAFLIALPLLLLAARWFGARGLGLTVLTTSLLWLGATISGVGPFTDLTLNDSLLNMQIMLAVFAIAGLIVLDVEYLRSVPALVVFLVGSSIAGIIFTTQSWDARTVDERHLRNVATRIQDSFGAHMVNYVNALQGGASFYAASSNVSRHEWRKYVQSLDLVDRYPGINGVGVTIPVDKTNAGTFVDVARRDSAPDFTIKPVPGIDPAAADHAQHFVIIYAEPVELNAAAIGLDLASEPRRRAAALTARDTAGPSITGRVTLVQDRKQGPGFLLFVPMYRENPKELSAQALRWAFHGWIYAPFIAEAFFGRNMIAEGVEVDLRIFDGPEPNPAELMFDTTAAKAHSPAHPFTPELQTNLTLYGHDFTVQWARSPLFDGKPRRLSVVFCAGLILFATLLAALIATLMTQKDRANAVAEEMTAALRASNARFELAAACTQDGIWDLDLLNNEVWTSPRYFEMFGYDPATIPDPDEFWRKIILPEDEARSREQYAALLSGQRDDMNLIQRYRHRDGRILHVHSRGLALRDDTGKVIRVIGVHNDISEVMKLQARFKDAVTVMKDGFGLFDADDRLILCNDGFIDEGTRKVIGDPTGHTFEEVVRAFVDHDMPDARDPAFDREAWIAQRMERHRNPPKEPIEVKWGGDRWMRISERRTADGGYVGIWSDVTEIRRLGQRLRDAIDALSDGFALFDADDRLVVCNEPYVTPAVRQAIGNPNGHTFEELYQAYARIDLGLTDPKARDAWVAGRLQLHRNPTDKPYEVMTHDGHHLRVLEQRTSDGGTVGTWTDVTAERAAERRLQDAISALSDGFALFDAEDRLVLCNDSFMHSPSMNNLGPLIGQTMEQILRGFAHGTPTDRRALADPEGWIAHRLHIHRNPGPEPYEQVLTDGRVLHISERRTAEGGIVGIWQDVTALRVAERRLHDAIASINEGFILLDADLRYVLFNDEFLRLYPKMAPYVTVGGRFEDALRQGILAGEYPDLDAPEKIEAFVADWMARYRDPAAFQGEGAFADGRWVLIGHHGTADGGSVNVYSDITALKHRESDLAAAKERLENQALELIDHPLACRRDNALTLAASVCQRDGVFQLLRRQPGVDGGGPCRSGRDRRRKTSPPALVQHRARRCWHGFGQIWQSRLPDHRRRAGHGAVPRGRAGALTATTRDPRHCRPPTLSSTSCACWASWPRPTGP